MSTRTQSAAPDEHGPIQISNGGRVDDDALGVVPLGDLSANLRHIHESVAVQE
jgi:hypothetical protein